ncbi:MAG: hypothetical protein N3D11_07525 [Candidatus Sumerlaeia bacterium]|nr:hypothetical protein [Candidatus Sumerlaeia bacterium]
MPNDISFVLRFRNRLGAALLLAICIIPSPAAPSPAPAQNDWFDRMAVPMASGSDFVSVRDASLKALGLYSKDELLLGPWYVTAPWPRDGAPVVPLQSVDVTTQIQTAAGRLVWQPVKDWTVTTQPLDLAPYSPVAENVSAYLYRSISAPGPVSVELRVSADDDYTVWLNGREVMSRTEDGLGAAYAKHRCRLVLRRGENELVIRVGQNTGPWRLFFDLEPQIDPRIHARVLYEALRLFPHSAEAHEARLELAALFLQLADRDRALEQAATLLDQPTVAPEVRARAETFIHQFLHLSLSTSQPWNLFTPDELSSGTIPIALSLTNHTTGPLSGEIALTLLDVASRPVLRLSPIAYTLGPNERLSRTIAFQPPSFGAYSIAAETHLGKTPIRRELTAGLIPPPRPGMRPHSFFAATTSGEEHIAAIAKTGVKVVRDFFCNYQWVLKNIPVSSTAPLELDFARLDKAIADRKAAGLSVLPIVGDARPLESALAKKLKASGPPDNLARFTSVTVQIVQRYPEISYWDFWGEPEIYGPTWAGTAANFRYSLKTWAQEAKRVRPNIKVLAGGRPSFFMDIILTDPNVAKVLDGLTNAIPFDLRAPAWRSGAVVRAMDFATSIARSQGMALSFVTGGGSARSLGQTGMTPDKHTDAAKIVKFHVLAALAGCFQCAVTQNQGWGPDFPVGNVAHAVLCDLLEDRPIVADIWPEHPLIWGAVFAHPRWITDAVRELPRAREISTRWNAPIPPDRANDSLKVAVVWSETGPAPDRLDSSGTLAIQPADDLRCLDMFGRSIGQKAGNMLTVPFTAEPVYLLSETLSVADLRARIASARIAGLTPANAYLFPLQSPLGASPTTLTARIQNQLNRPLKATVALEGPAEWTLTPATQSVELAPAALGEVAFKVTATSSTAFNQYLVRVRIESDAGRFDRRQVVGVACIRPLTVKVDGRLDEWTTATFTRVDSEMQRDLDNYLQWLSDIRQPFRGLPPGVAYVGTKLAVAYDAANLYIGAVVREPGLGNATAPQPASYGQNPLTNGDCWEFAFGFGERATDDLRKPDAPWFWKGMFRDTDYVLLLSRDRADNPFLLTLQVPGLTWRTDFQTERVNTWPVAGGQARFVRDEAQRTTTWEIAIPRRYLNRFDPARPWVRFGYVYFNDEKLPPLEWARACGVFDYWTNLGSFLPAWNALLACQTRWGIGK